MAIDPNRQLRGRGLSTANLEFFDALVRHQVFVLRMSGSIRNDVIALLNATEQDIAMRIRDRLRTSRGVSERNLRRARKLIDEIRDIRSQAWDGVDNLWTTSFNDFVKEEAQFNNAALRTVVPVRVSTVLPAAATLRSLVRDMPFEGRVLRAWSASQRQSDINAIADQIRIGLVQGESSAQMARRVVGTARLNGADGVTHTARRHAAAITRTATIAYSNAARREFLVANDNLFTEELYVATLDGRTTPICRSLDGRRFPVGEGPIPPLHFNCRSLRVAVISDEAIGSRPSKPVTNRRLLRRFAEENRLSGIRSRSDLPRGFKGRFDRFLRTEVRRLTGRVPAKLTYQQWLTSQSATFQDDVLGVTRGRLFRRGNLTLDRFVNRAGDEIPLSELARRDADAFRAAGLDPDEFTRGAAP